MQWTVNAFITTDAQINYRVPEIKSMIKREELMSSKSSIKMLMLIRK